MSSATTSSWKNDKNCENNHKIRTMASFLKEGEHLIKCNKNLIRTGIEVEFSSENIKHSLIYTITPHTVEPLKTDTPWNRPKCPS